MKGGEGWETSGGGEEEGTLQGRGEEEGRGEGEGKRGRSWGGVRGA